MVADQQKQEKQFLAITFVLVVLLGGASFVSVMAVPTQAVRAIEAVRNPASLPESHDSLNPAPVNLSKLEDLTWDCKNKNFNVELAATHFRLKGKAYCKGQPIKDLSVRNLSNGFTASIFTNEKGFLTDFIDLQPGANEIRLVYNDRTGKASEVSLTILRK